MTFIRKAAWNGSPIGPPACWKGSTPPRFAARRVGLRIGSRKWLQLQLQLRLGACRRGRIVEGGVTTIIIEQLDLERCPVTRRLLTHGTRTPADWCVHRLNNDAAYAPSNLAVISTRANQARGSLRFEAVMALSALQQHIHFEVRRGAEMPLSQPTTRVQVPDVLKAPKRHLDAKLERRHKRFDA